MTKAYIYYSGATDITGKKLVDTLKDNGFDVTGGSSEPKGKQTVICWGAKTSKDIEFPKTVTKVLNHPNAIRANRNKFQAIQTMAAALNTTDQLVIPRFVTADVVKNELATGNISFPMIGRSKYHQGGKGFRSCPTLAQLDAALADEKIHHFQEMIPVKDEYRLHVFGDKVIHAVKKVERTDKEFEEAWVQDEIDRQKSLAEKNNDAFDEEMVRRVLKRQVKNAIAGGANQVLRSNRMGWKFSIVKKYKKELEDKAVAAVKALGLDFGAVDCCLDTNDNPYIFEVNTGPGLEGTSFDKYIEAFTEALTEKKEVKKTSTTTKKKVEKKRTVGEAVTERDYMKTQLVRLQDMLDDADDAELGTIRKVATALIFGGRE